VYIMAFTDEITDGIIHRYFHRWLHRWKCHVTVRLSQFESLNHSVGKIIWKTPRHHTVTSFQTNFIGRQRSGRYIPTEIFCRYIPTVSPMDLYHRYIPTDFEMELFPSVIITDEKISSVIPLVFTDFLVVIYIYIYIYIPCIAYCWWRTYEIWVLLY
jgi:hypothetical protein